MLFCLIYTVTAAEPKFFFPDTNMENQQGLQELDPWNQFLLDTELDKA